jgi:crotonobetainyl-CoA:carnitine CoA-transferase CaiB-like acyl-CoA transferase
MKAFDGIRVLDLTHVLAGPFSTYQLAVLGADVIKIEGPENPDMNREIGAVHAFNQMEMGTHFQSQAANKRAIKLDLKSEAGKDVFLKLAATADVIVENFRSGVMSRLGLGYDDVTAVKPDIIYCSITGFGQTGPKQYDPAFDNTIQAFSGMMMATGPEDDDPVLIGPPVLDYGTGIQASFAIASALLRRERMGEGQYLDVAMLDAALMLMTAGVLNVNTTGQPPGRSRYSRTPYAGYGGYQTSDGETLMIGAVTPTQYAKLWRALGRDDLAAEVDGKRTCDMPALSDRFEPVLVDILAQKTGAEWEAMLLGVGLPAGRVQTMKDALRSEQIASRTVVGSYPSEHSKHGSMQPAVAAFATPKDGPEVTSAPPSFGQHTQEILSQLGYTPDDITRLAQAGVI